MEKMEGKPMVEFALPDQDGNLRNINEFKGRYILLYFYPKDMTPGCTTEAQCFRDRMNDLGKFGVQVIGVSTDNTESHKNFAKKHHLNFPILSDIEKKVVNAYGVFKEKSFLGRKYMGTNRESFLINPDGVIVKHYKKVKPSEHADEVIYDMENL